MTPDQLIKDLFSEYGTKIHILTIRQAASEYYYSLESLRQTDFFKKNMKEDFEYDDGLVWKTVRITDRRMIRNIANTFMADTFKSVSSISKQQLCLEAEKHGLGWHNLRDCPYFKANITASKHGTYIKRPPTEPIKYNFIPLPDEDYDDDNVLADDHKRLWKLERQLDPEDDLSETDMDAWVVEFDKAWEEREARLKAKGT